MNSSAHRAAPKKVNLGIASFAKQGHLSSSVENGQTDVQRRNTGRLSSLKPKRVESKGIPSQAGVTY